MAWPNSGTTLVGQSLGAGDPACAMRVGSRVIFMTAVLMGRIGIAWALTSPLLLPLFTDGHDENAAAAIALGLRLLWFAAVHQIFDALNMSSGMCLRGAGDVVVPAAWVIPVSWFVFVPLAHILAFAPGQG
jgi:multidrug resistance protein, MATE family